MVQSFNSVLLHDGFIDDGRLEYNNNNNDNNVTLVTGRVCPVCGGVPRPNQQGCSSVLERVGQLAIGGDDRGCSSIFVFVSTDFRCGATI